MGEFIEESKKAFDRITKDIGTAIGLSLIMTATLAVIGIGAFLLVKSQNAAGFTAMAIGTIIGVYLGGYNIENFHNLLKGKRLPKVTKNVLNKFKWGILSFVIALAYASPVVIADIALIAANVQEVFVSLTSNIIAIIIMFPAAAALIEYSRRNKFKDAFKWEVIKKAYRAKFVGFYLGGILIGYLIMVGIAITIVGAFIILALGPLYMQHMAVAGYVEKKHKRKVRRKRRKK